jgi:hypothetical protein
VQAGNHDEVLRRIADRLWAEFADPDVAELPGIRSTLGDEKSLSGRLGAADEALVARLREVLAAIGATLAEGNDEPPVGAIKIVLDGAELFVRGELLADNADSVLRQIPSFVFLVATLVGDQDGAIELSRRTEELIDEVAPRRP